MKSFLKKLYRKIAFPKEQEPIVDRSIDFNKIQVNLIRSNGELNKDKIFYVIQRNPGKGFFSNVAFVTNHIKVALDNGFIPIVDMENFVTWYNENNKILKTNNAWEYYFEQISNFSLKDVYKSKNIILTNRNFYRSSGFLDSINEDKELKNVFQKYILIKKNKLKVIHYLKKKLFEKKKILGVHFRGTGYKIGRQPHPATIKQMINRLNKILSKENYDKIFLVTEDLNNFKAIIAEFKDKVIYLNNSVRENNSNTAFDTYPRLNHRYKLGRDILIEACLLSYCDGYLDIRNNVREAAIAFNLNPNQKRYFIDNGHNSAYPVIGKYIWYIKSFLPKMLGGFDQK